MSWLKRAKGRGKRGKCDGRFQGVLVLGGWGGGGREEWGFVGLAQRLERSTHIHIPLRLESADTHERT